MTQLIPIACLLLGALIGAVVVWWAARRQAATEIAVLNERLSAQLQSLATANDQIESLQGDVNEILNQWTAAQQQVVALSTMRQKERGENAQKLKLLEEAEMKLSGAFQNLASDALRRNNESFLLLAKERLETHQTAAAGDLEKRQQAI